MKKTLFSLALAFAAFTTQAQWQADGSTLSGTFTMTDLNATSYDAFTMLNQGKHVVIDLSATWCGPCWAYHNTNVLDNYYDDYNAGTGTLNKDAQVFLYEVDGSTNLADLQGTGSNTQGDWITGTTHPICDPSNSSSVLSKFLTPGTTSYGVPAVFVICNNKKFYKISTNITDVTSLRSYIGSKCPLAPLSTTEVIGKAFNFDVYPNPSNNLVTLHLQLDKSNSVSFNLFNSVGQIVYSSATQNMNSGNQDIEINTANLSNGMYILDLQVGDEKVNTKIAVSH